MWDQQNSKFQAWRFALSIIAANEGGFATTEM